MTIGQFAQASGLTVTALRFYDEKGLLQPREVDRDTGYRRYAAAQLRRAAMVKVLRQMGMSLAHVRDVIDNQDRTTELLGQFTRDVHAQRARQDTAIRQGTDTLASYEQLTVVQSREAPEQHWVGAVMPVDLVTVDADQGVEDYNAAFARLAQALHAVGNPPVGSFWSIVRGADTLAKGDVVLCWPVATAATEFTANGLRIEAGTLPARVESFVRIEFDSEHYPRAASDADVAHPALIALMEHLEEAGHDAELIRQVCLTGEDGLPVGIDIAVTTAVIP